MSLRELAGDQRRQMIDTQQVYEAWENADSERRRRFVGSMRWAERNGTEYLLRKTGIRETSLGSRDSSTEEAINAFSEGRQKNKALLAGLSARLEKMAPVNAAMGLGRVPTIAARILRRCHDRDLLGRQLFVVGTNALYAYEAKAGVQMDSGLIATGDIDLLYDARQRLSLATAGGLRESGLIGLLQQVDKSFEPVRPRAFRATNRDGYLVDLIRPLSKEVMRDRIPAAMTDLPGDLEGVGIEGLVWLINAPKFDAIAIDERGYPVRIIAIDPRVFALHKAWLSRREDREPIKSTRDLAQSKAAATIAVKYLNLGFDSPALNQLPAALRQAVPQIIEDGGQASGEENLAPNW